MSVVAVSSSGLKLSSDFIVVFDIVFVVVVGVAVDVDGVFGCVVVVVVVDGVVRSVAGCVLVVVVVVSYIVRTSVNLGS